jgi:hypothetical protein
MLDVPDAPGREIVDDKNLVTAPQVCVSEMRSDETRSACNQYAQMSLS